MMTREDLAAMPKRRPKVIAGAVFMPGLRDAFAWGLVEVAITPRYEPAAQTDTEPQTAREWFDRYYSVVTKDNADSLPEYM